MQAIDLRNQQSQLSNTNPNDKNLQEQYTEQQQKSQDHDQNSKEKLLLHHILKQLQKHE